MTLLPLMPGGTSDIVDFVPSAPLERLVLPADTRAGIERVLDEQRNAQRLSEHGLLAACRLLFHGPPGCGKTAAAGSIAHALDLPFAVARTDGIVDSHLGSTSIKLRKVFDLVKSQRMVVLFDEIDGIARARHGADSASAAADEMNRAVNSLLTMLGAFTGPSIIVAATNHESALDGALWRRFDTVIRFPMPSGAQAATLLNALLARHGATPVSLSGKRLEGLSFGDVETIALDTVKTAILRGSPTDIINLTSALEGALTRHRARRAAPPAREKKSP